MSAREKVDALAGALWPGTKAIPEWDSGPGWRVWCGGDVAGEGESEEDAFANAVPRLRAWVRWEIRTSLPHAQREKIARLTATLAATEDAP